MGKALAGLKSYQFLIPYIALAFSIVAMNGSCRDEERRANLDVAELINQVEDILGPLNPQGSPTIFLKNDPVSLREAERLINRAELIDPDHPMVMTARGSLLSASCRYEEAVVQFRKAREKHPSNIAVALRLARALTYGRADEAEKIFRDVLSRQPQHVEALQMLALALGEQGKSDEALSYFRKVVKIAPLEAAAHSSLRGILGRRGQLREAMFHARKHVELTPKDPMAHFGVGSILGKLGRHDEALNSYKQAHSLSPRSVRVRYQVAATLRAVGQNDEAILEARAILDSDDDGRTWTLLAALLSEQGDSAGARASFLRATRLLGDHPVLRDWQRDRVPNSQLIKRANKAFQEQAESKSVFFVMDLLGEAGC